MDKIDNESARSYVASLPHYPRKDFMSFFVGANPTAVDLLGQLLDMDPDKRPTAAEALDHPYLAKYHDPEDEVSLSSLSLSLISLSSIYSSSLVSFSLLLPSFWNLSLFSTQPECDRQYDDSFENMELDVEGWRSEFRFEVVKHKKLDRFVNSKCCGKRRLIVIFPLPSFRAGIR